MKKYDEIKFKELDWYVIEEKDNKVKLLLKNILDKDRIDKYADDDFMIDGCEVRHQDTIRPYDWEKSYIKNTILPAFKKDLDIDCKVDLMTKEEVEALPINIRKCNKWFWTKSRRSDSTDASFFVSDAGYVYSSIVNNYRGVRPVLYLDSTQFFTENTRLKSCKEKIEIIKELLVDLEKCLEEYENGK